jgi:hypothetical protein
MIANCTRPEKIYRYSEHEWLEHALKRGEFRLRPATDYLEIEKDAARHDDELRKSVGRPDGSVKVHLEDGTELKGITNFRHIRCLTTNYYVLSFSSSHSEQLYDDFAPADACLIIHAPEEFGERVHVAAQKRLPNWVGADCAVSYGEFSPFGPVYTKPTYFSSQSEWRFSWLPPFAVQGLEPVFIQAGNLESIASIAPRYQPNKMIVETRA